MFSDCNITDYQKASASWKAVCFGWMTDGGHGLSSLALVWNLSVSLGSSCLLNLKP